MLRDWLDVSVDQALEFAGMQKTMEIREMNQFLFDIIGDPENEQLRKITLLFTLWGGAQNCKIVRLMRHDCKFYHDFCNGWCPVQKRLLDLSEAKTDGEFGPENSQPQSYRGRIH